MVGVTLFAAAISTTPTASAAEIAHECPALHEATERSTRGTYHSEGRLFPWWPDYVFLTPEIQHLPSAMEAGLAGVLYLDGYLPVSVSANQDGPACPAELVPGTAPVVRGRVEVIGLPASLEIWASGCGNAVAVKDGQFLMPVAEEDCEVVVHATDYKNYWKSTALVVPSMTSGATFDLTFAVDAMVAWAAVHLTPSGSSWTVSGFPAGSQAAAAGLTLGDTLASVDGIPVAGLQHAEVVELLDGPQASYADITTTSGTTYQVLRTPFDESFSGGNVGIRVEDVGGRLVVAEATGAAARKGIRPGDVIIASGGKPASDWEAGRLTLHWRGGGWRRVVVQRGDTTRRVILPVRITN